MTGHVENDYITFKEQNFKVNFIIEFYSGSFDYFINF